MDVVSAYAYYLSASRVIPDASAPLASRLLLRELLRMLHVYSAATPVASVIYRHKMAAFLGANYVALATQSHTVDPFQLRD